MSEQVKSEHVMQGQVKSGHVKSGQLKSGQVMSGQVKSGCFLTKHFFDPTLVKTYKALISNFNPNCFLVQQRPNCTY